MKVKVNNKVVTISEKTIEKYMNDFALDKESAIQMYLEDEGYEINPEQIQLQEKAEKVKVNHDTGRKKAKTTARERKPDETKEKLITDLAEFLESKAENIKIENVGKLITFSIGDENFTLNLIRNRKKKD